MKIFRREILMGLHLQCEDRQNQFFLFITTVSTHNYNHPYELKLEVYIVGNPLQGMYLWNENQNQTPVPVSKKCVKSKIILRGASKV